MKVGFRLHYQRHDAAFMTFRLADLFAELGYEVEIYPYDKPAILNSHWDRVVIKDSNLDPVEWTKTLSHVVHFGRVGTAEELAVTRKAKTKAVFVCLWQLLTKEELPMLKQYDTVVCPSRRANVLIKEKSDLDTIQYIPWDPGVPQTFPGRDVNPNRMGVLWPLDGSQTYNQNPKFLPIIERLIRRTPEIYLTITYSGNMKTEVVKELRRLAQVAEGRVELIRNPSWEKHALLYGYNDLTVWPSLVEGVPHVGLCSLFMSTPVIAFDHPVIGEVVRDNKSGILVPCELEENWLGVPWVKPDFTAFGIALDKLLNDHEGLSKMRQWAPVGLKEQTGHFKNRWTKIIDE